jgi:hypothetical protein
VVHYACATGEEGVIVVEAKNLGVSLKSEKDLDPGYYLELPEFAGFRQRSLIYLLDEPVGGDRAQFGGLNGKLLTAAEAEALIGAEVH